MLGSITIHHEYRLDIGRKRGISMADIELVIKIPEEIYQHYKRIWQKRRGSIPESCIAFGTPLPKGHRGIVDLKSVQWAFDDAIVEDALSTGQVRATHNEIANILETVPKIIEADTAESEDSE